MGRNSDSALWILTVEMTILIGKEVENMTCNYFEYREMMDKMFYGVDSGFKGGN